MADAKRVPIFLLILNLILYFIVIILATWAVNYGIQTHDEIAYLSTPARIFPMYFPFGNMATGFLVIFSLVAGIVGFTTSITGISNLREWDYPNLLTTAASSLTTWFLTLLAMGLACKEINMGWTDSDYSFPNLTHSNLHALEACIIILSWTQLFYVVAIQAVAGDMHETLTALGSSIGVV
ncbi:membrane protein PM19L-like [Cornus florida]|uniref:membrane protein PM19L-like n=1 Tax=Cornus florida TaxID=4283 RepID=UPI00289AF908|nr:membrane protein PM19L-like [Cornus florida]